MPAPDSMAAAIERGEADAAALIAACAATGDPGPLAARIEEMADVGACIFWGAGFARTVAQAAMAGAKLHGQRK